MNSINKTEKYYCHGAQSESENNFNRSILTNAMLVDEPSKFLFNNLH